MSREDPKHGRWILPIVVAALIGFTYVFVNALPAGTVPGGTTTTVVGGSTTSSTATTSSTTTTTLAPEVAAFVAATENLEASAETLLTRARELNESWDAGDAGFGATRDGLTEVRDGTLGLVADVGDISPPASVTGWTAVTDAVDEMATAAAGMLDGLVNAPGPEPRQAALADYEAAVNDLRTALAAVRAEASG